MPKKMKPLTLKPSTAPVPTNRIAIDDQSIGQDVLIRAHIPIRTERSLNTGRSLNIAISGDATKEEVLLSLQLLIGLLR